jgi:hypothetical protein
MRLSCVILLWPTFLHILSLCARMQVTLTSQTTRPHILELLPSPIFCLLCLIARKHTLKRRWVFSWLKSPCFPCDRRPGPSCACSACVATFRGYRIQALFSHCLWKVTWQANTQTLTDCVNRLAVLWQSDAFREAFLRENLNELAI